MLKLASFRARAIPFSIDFALAGGLFTCLMLGAIAITKYVPALRDWDAGNQVHIEHALAYGTSALEPGFGFLRYFMHPNRQTVHGRIAETIMVEQPGRLSRDE